MKFNVFLNPDPFNMAANLKQCRLVISTYVRICSSKNGRVAGEYSRSEDDSSLDDRGCGAYRYW